MPGPVSLESAGAIVRDLSTSRLYVISQIIDDPKLRRKRVWFVGYAELPGNGGTMAVVRMARTTLDFTEGEEWQVRPSFLVEG